MKETITALKGEGPEDVMEITHTLAGTMIYLGEKAASIEEGIQKSREAVQNGQAFQKWLELVKAHGGDTNLIQHPETYPKTEFEETFTARKSGYIQAFDAYEIGMASLELGAGRRTKEDGIDPAAGIILHKKRGDYVESGETIARCFTNKQAVIEAVLQKMNNAVSIGAERPPKTGLIQHRVDNKGVHDLKT